MPRWSSNRVVDAGAPNSTSTTSPAVEEYLGVATVDVVSEALIPRPVAEVANYAADPSNAPEWYANISSVEWETPPPVTVGSRVTFVARFLGRRLTYTYEITEYIPGERLTMRTAQGPFPMATSYTWQPAPHGTRMILHNRGEPSGFGALAIPAISAAMKRANAKDLATLSTVLQQRHS